MSDVEAHEKGFSPIEQRPRILEITCTVYNTTVREKKAVTYSGIFERPY
jgi:hypothetical protein